MKSLPGSDASDDQPCELNYGSSYTKEEVLMNRNSEKIMLRFMIRCQDDLSRGKRQR